MLLASFSYDASSLMGGISLRRLLALALCVVVMCFAGSARADQWGMSGKMSQFLKRSGDYDDVKYPALSSGYSPGSPFSFFTVRKGDENLLVVLRLNDKDAFEEVGRYPGALRKAPGGKPTEFWKKSTEDGIHLKNMWSDTGEEYDFAWNGQEMVLRYANTGSLSISLKEDDSGYVVSDGVSELAWLEHPLLLAEFCMDMLPQDMARIEQANQLSSYYCAMLDLAERVRVDMGKKKNLPVYAAPFENAYRGAYGKAAVSLREPFDVLAVLDDGWAMVEYEITRSERRIGFVQGLGDVGAQELFLLGQPGRLARAASVTDDPHATCRELTVLEAGAEVEVLGYLDAFWLCVQTEVEGKRAWGFIPADALALPEATP